jgi:hypothetical protein
LPLAAPPSWLTPRTRCSVPCQKSTAKTTPAAFPPTRRLSGPIRRRLPNRLNAVRCLQARPIQRPLKTGNHRSPTRRARVALAVKRG